MPTILVADDEYSICVCLSMLFGLEGWECLTAADGAEALQVLNDNEVDLLVLDIMMPRMDGLEVLRRVRDTEATAELIVVMLTAMSDPGSQARSLGDGADWYITKPYEPAHLIEIVKRLLAITPQRDGS